MAANETEKEAHDKLMEVMDEEGQESYSNADIDVMVSKTRKACNISGRTRAVVGAAGDGDLGVTPSGLDHVAVGREGAQ